MDTTGKNVDYWFRKSTFGHQEELGFKRDSFTENEMMLFGQTCAEKQREEDIKRAIKAHCQICCDCDCPICARNTCDEVMRIRLEMERG